MNRLSPIGTAGAPRHKTVVIADDSVVVRGLFARWLGESGQFHLVAVAGDGETAVAHAGRFKPDVMVLDLDMPGVDGATALPQILRESPHTGVLLATTLNERNTRIALECMTKGAMDVVSKPDSRSGLTLSLEFRSEFLLKLGNVAQARPKPGALPVDVELDFIPGGNSGLRQLVSVVPRYLVIGASTGGPRAVARVLFDIGDALHDLTTVVVQHMPPVFTASFAEQISSYIGIPAREPFDGERLVRGTIYVAPGGRHLGIDRRLGHITASIDDGPPVRFCRPAVDVLFNDAARHLGPAALGLVLTGMGADGTEGAGALRRAGAAVIAQDEQSSTIWGMPGSIVRAQHASAVIGLDDIGAAIRGLVRMGQPS
ncbi:MAG: chemotaxis-specific protein-glutamate methyltransferase CheB [Bosea sp. (in: a-proteobacteria)]|uniref:chemotaxis-specific protein-glutamate methyltransferase CheB n=1 Tax=Bosea sp. (in: a-proteobacteria) TaxID=1871050 RepID=UPI0027376CF7|nr:chemotaxis-specific protein-glutamate methyltransferase CheB [Bosea sp. (in: a-proteobacteria)]MDP3599859.1 chemotaxis-specific protein-glutamate methyltransferase CheB [Bosea sp. (in: a-proteobacteria)]